MTDHSGASAAVIERLLSYREVSELLGVTERTVWTLVDRGRLQNVRFGRSVRIAPADLRSFIDKCKRQPESEVTDGK